MSDTEHSASAFGALGLSSSILDAIAELGYESPSPIQAESVPPLLEGSDLLGQAQTGTGKTAAFALPLLQRVNPADQFPQLLVLAPTRELALQVSEACEKYAKYMSGVRILSIYGGQAYDTQIRALRRGVQVVIGTPGRVMDHMRRGTLQLDRLQALVLDEADEMLRMGFIDDVEWVLQHTPPARQIALFSATMPREIRHIAENYLQQPKLVKIEAKTETASTIRQRIWQVRGMSKFSALTRILETQEKDATLIFVRTKTATEELSEQLRKEGFPAAALHGDIAQQQRERVVDQLKRGKIDILVATDVVARGLDVERISQVVNFDIPYDAESYIHRIGRTGRAGREGDAILFVTPRERHLLRQIERTTRSPLETLELPTAKQINELRVQKLKQRLVNAIDETQSNEYQKVINELVAESGISASAIASAAVSLMMGQKSFFLNENERDPNAIKHKEDRINDRRKERGQQRTDENMSRYWIAVGHQHGVKPGNIVGAIANEANISSSQIGRVDISENFSTVDLPDSLKKEQLSTLANALVCGQKLQIRPWNDEPPKGRGKPRRGAPGKGGFSKGAPGKGGAAKRGDRKDSGSRPSAPDRKKREKKSA